LVIAWQGAIPENSAHITLTNLFHDIHKIPQDTARAPRCGTMDS
jgi:hypothetical protein